MTHATQVGHSDEANSLVAATSTSATKEPPPSVEILMDGDCFENNEGGDISTVVLADKGKGVDPREYGSALYDPKLMIVHADTTSPGESDVLALIGFHRDKGKNTDPAERGNGMAKDEPNPNQMNFPDDEDILFQAILLESQPTVPTLNLKDRLSYDPTLPQCRWHPKISPYRFTVLLTPLAIGTAKAVLSQKGSVKIPITLEWICGVVIFLL